MGCPAVRSGTDAAILHVCRKAFQIFHQLIIFGSIFLFAYIARPGVVEQLFPDRNVQHTFVDSAQTAEKGDDIGFSCCQRGKAERKNVQAEKEVFAKAFFVYHFSQVTVCGGEDTDINADDAASADPDNLLLLENAQKPGLERVRQR